LKPDLFSGRQINVCIELNGEFTTGMTVADWWSVSKRPANATFLRDIDANGFYDLLIQRIGRLP
jgi:purine nucleosidase